MHNRQGLTPKLLWLSLLDWDLWPIYLLGLTWQIPPQPVTAYLTLNLKALGFNTFQTNLMTIPAYVLFLIQLVFWTWLSERVNDRMTTVLVSQLWMLPIILALELLSTSASPWIWYTLSILLIGYPYVHAILGTFFSSCLFFLVVSFLWLSLFSCFLFFLLAPFFLPSALATH